MEDKHNETTDDSETYFDEYKTILPNYLRITVGLLVTLIFLVGTIGNLMVMMVITCSRWRSAKAKSHIFSSSNPVNLNLMSTRGMRSSTNFFLVNLSLADLLVLLFVTPTALLEVIYTPDIWLLGSIMCKVIPVLELLVSHASVLTILAISLERYYAICTPLKVLYICTKSRAVKICIIIWVVAFIVTCPTLFSIYFVELPGVNDNGEEELQPMCIVSTGQLWQYLYQLCGILIFFLIPLLILLTIYRKIAVKMRSDRSTLNVTNEGEGAERSRGQVVHMLGAVVFIFFFCFLPFRLLALAFLLTDFYAFLNRTSARQEIYYGILYFCRIMIYVNSAVNPILYNVMSSKFRNGFRHILCRGILAKPSPNSDELSLRRTRL